MPELAGYILSKQPVEQRECRHQRQRPADHTPGRFQHHQEQRHRHRELKVALDKSILVPEHIAVERHPKRCGDAQCCKDTPRDPPHGRACVKDQGEGEDKDHMQRPADKVRHQT